MGAQVFCSSFGFTLVWCTDGVSAVASLAVKHLMALNWVCLFLLSLCVCLSGLASMQFFMPLFCLLQKIFARVQHRQNAKFKSSWFRPPLLTNFGVSSVLNFLKQAQLVNAVLLQLQQHCGEKTGKEGATSTSTFPASRQCRRRCLSCGCCAVGN